MPITISQKRSGGSGATVVTGNGLSGDGSVGSPVILGGTLTQDTTVDGSNFVLDFLATDGANNSGDISNSNNGPTLTGQSDQNDSATVSAGNTPGLGAWWDLVFNNLSSRKQAISSKFAPLNTGHLGLQVNDNIDNVGLNGAALFPVNNPDQYAQYGNISANVGTVNTALQTATQTFLLYTVNATHNQLLRVNPAIFLNSLGATTNVSYALSYTDQAGTVRSITLATLTTLTTPTIPTQTIYAEKNTAVNLTVILNIPGGGYQVYATCEYLGIQN